MSDKLEIQKLGDPYDFDISEIAIKDMGILYHSNKNSLEILHSKLQALGMSLHGDRNALDISQCGSGNLNMYRDSQGYLGISRSKLSNLEMIARGVLIYHPTSQYLPAVKDFLQNPNDLTDLYVGQNSVNDLFGLWGNVYTKGEIDDFFEGESHSGKKQVHWDNIVNKLYDFLYYTDEMAQDAVGEILAGTQTIDLVYNDGAPSITANVRKQMSIVSDSNGIRLSGDLPDPGNQKYYGTDEFGTKGFWDVMTGKIKVSSNDIVPGYLEDKFSVSHGSNTTYPLELTTLNEGGNENRQLQLDISKINHDALLNWVANKHIDHSQVFIIAGDGMIGGGDITQSRTLDVVTQMSVTYDENGVMLSGDLPDPGLKKYYGTHPTTGERGWYSGGLVSFGTDNQIPFMNAAGNDFEYSNNLIFNSTYAVIQNQLVVRDTTGAEGINFFSNLGSAQQIYSDYWTGSERALILGTFSNKTNQLYLATNGYVGIGTTDPNSTLDVRGNQSEVLDIHNQTSLASGVTTEIGFKTGSYWTGLIKTIGNNAVSARMGFFTYASSSKGSLYERLTISDNGFIGINNTAPNTDLDIKSSQNIYGARIRLREATLEGTNYIDLKCPNSIVSSVTYLLPEIGTPGYFLKLDDSSGTLIWATPGEGFEDPMTTRGDMIYRNTSNITDRLPSGGSGNEGKILTVANVGGEYVPQWQTPASGLTLGGDIDPVGQIQYRVENNFAANDDFYYNPINKDLYVLGSKIGGKFVSLRNTHDGSGSSMGVWIGNDISPFAFYLQINSSQCTYANYAYLWQDRNAPLLIGTNGTERMRIDASGNIRFMTDGTYLSFDASADRIGFVKKTGSYGKLAYGSGASFAIAQANTTTILPGSTYTDRLIIDGNGNIGINVTPSVLFDVVGDSSYGRMLLSDKITDEANKYNKIGIRHYLSDEEPFYVLFSQITNNDNWLNIGGGTSQGNAATAIHFFTAANSTTTVGTNRLSIYDDSIQASVGIYASGGNSILWTEAYISKHNKQHSIISTLDHTSSATPNRLLMANANGLPINASAVNTDSNVADAVNKKHTQNTDIELGSGCIAKNHGTSSIDQVVNVCYGTDVPPDAGTVTEGALFIKYTA